MTDSLHPETIVLHAGWRKDETSNAVAVLEGGWRRCAIRGRR